MRQPRNWQKLSSKTVYKNKWVEIVEDQVVMPDGKKGIYAYMKKSNGCFIIALDEHHYVYMVEEYRYPIQKSILQLAAGSLDGQDELLTARKELFEETGIKARSWRRLGGFYQGPGHETIYDSIYLATDLDTSNIKTDSQESDESILRIIKVSVDKLKEMVRKNKIECAMSAAALNLFFLKLPGE